MMKVCYPSDGTKSEGLKTSHIGGYNQLALFSSGTRSISNSSINQAIAGKNENEKRTYCGVF